MALTPDTAGLLVIGVAIVIIVFGWLYYHRMPKKAIMRSDV